MALSIRARLPLPKTKRTHSRTLTNTHTQQPQRYTTPGNHNHNNKQTQQQTNKHNTQTNTQHPNLHPSTAHGWIHSRNALLYFFYGSADVKPNSHHFSALCRWLVVYTLCTYPPGGDSLPNNPDLYQANSNACSTAVHPWANYILAILFTFKSPLCFLTQRRPLKGNNLCTSGGVLPNVL